jgi:uncharacterized protein (DUF924 family)
MEIVNKIYKFWFKIPRNIDYTTKKIIRNYIKIHFKDIIKEAECGNLLSWLNNKKSFIVFIIILDKFSTILYSKNNLKTFENYKKALLFLEMGLDIHLNNLTPIEKLIVLSPYKKIENLDTQKIGKDIFKNLIKLEKTPKGKNILRRGLYYQLETIKILKKFGRFPERNYVLNREFTEEEIDYLDEITK